MKTVIFLLMLTSLSSCFSHPKMKTGLEGKVLPSFDLLLADSTTHFNTSKIQAGKPTILFYFDPKCPYSRAQMADIVENMKALSNIQFYIFTTAPFPELKSFYDRYQLKKYQNVTVGLDYTSYFGDYFKTNGVPYLAIYDDNKRLKQALLGKTDISDIKDLALK